MTRDEFIARCETIWQMGNARPMFCEHREGMK